MDKLLILDAVNAACLILERGVVETDGTMIDDDKPAQITAGNIRIAQSVIANAAMRVRDGDSPDIANLRCLESSVKNLIAALSRHNSSVLCGCIPTTGTISGDLYAVIAATIDRCIGHNARTGTDDTLSDLRDRYQLPKPIDAAPAGNDGSRELPCVRGEVSDGGGSAEHRGVCGSADEQPDLTDAGPQAFRFKVYEPQSPDLADAFAYTFGIDMAKPGGDTTAAMLYITLEQMEESLEQARSTTRRNIVAAISGMNGGFPPPGLPEQDVAVAIAVLRKAVKDENEAERNVQELERHLIDMSAKLAAYQVADDKRELVLRDAIKSRDGQIKALQAQVDKLARHIAFQVAK